LLTKKSQQQQKCAVFSKIYHSHSYKALFGMKVHKNNNKNIFHKKQNKILFCEKKT